MWENAAQMWDNCGILWDIHARLSVRLFYCKVNQNGENSDIFRQITPTKLEFCDIMTIWNLRHQKK